MIFALLLSLAVTLFSCGLDDFSFLYPVPQADITQEFNSRAIVSIDNRNNFSNSGFLNYIIYYRIYVHDLVENPTTVDRFSAINPALLSDYNAVRNLIGSTTFGNTNLDNIFLQRGFWFLELDGANIDSVLSSSVFGDTLIFDFSHENEPTMSIGGNTYTLLRSTGNNTFNPLPNRYFINTPALSLDANINTQINADVANKTGIAEQPRYTYAAMYIAALGLDTTAYTYIFSTPALIHVFLLPDFW